MLGQKIFSAKSISVVVGGLSSIMFIRRMALKSLMDGIPITLHKSLPHL